MILNRCFSGSEAIKDGCRSINPRIGCIAQAGDAFRTSDRGLIGHNIKRNSYARSGRVPAKGQEIATTYWERLDQKLQWVLEGGPVYWHRDPNPHQLMLFCRTIDELRGQ